MEKFTIEVQGAKVCYISSVPLQDYFLKNKDYLEFFNAKVINSEPNENDYVVIYNDCPDKDSPIAVRGNKMFINYPFEELNESIILYLGYHFLEKQLGLMGMCSCHSACVSKDGIATLIVGDAGSGKTSLAYNLCKDGYKLVSNDMTLIGLDEGKIMAFAGTKFMNLRLLSVEQNMRELLYLFKNDNKDNWTNKISIMARDIGLEEEYEPTEIDNIIFLRVDNREKLKISNGDSWRNNFLLYQNTSSHIRGSAATFINNKGYPIGYIPSMDTEESYYKRIELLNAINNKDNYKYIVGPLNEIVDFVNNLYKAKEEGLKLVYEKK